MEKQKNFENALEKAQKWVYKNHPHSCIRKKLNAVIDSYKDKDNRVEMIIIEGSPARGYIIIDYHINRILCVSFLMSKTYKISWGNSLW